MLCILQFVIESAEISFRFLLPQWLSVRRGRRFDSFPKAKHLFYRKSIGLIFLRVQLNIFNINKYKKCLTLWNLFFISCYWALQQKIYPRNCTKLLGFLCVCVCVCVFLKFWWTSQAKAVRNKITLFECPFFVEK